MAPKLQLLGVLALALALDACASEDDAPGPEEPETPPAVAVELLGFYDLPRKTATEGHSATFYDAGARRLFALTDTRPRLLPIDVGDDSVSFDVGAPIALTGRPDDVWDGEGLTPASSSWRSRSPSEELSKIAFGVALQAQRRPPRDGKGKELPNVGQLLRACGRYEVTDGRGSGRS